MTSTWLYGYSFRFPQVNIWQNREIFFFQWFPYKLGIWDDQILWWGNFLHCSVSLRAHASHTEKGWSPTPSRTSINRGRFLQGTLKYIGEEGNRVGGRSSQHNACLEMFKKPYGNHVGPPLRVCSQKRDRPELEPERARPLAEHLVSQLLMIGLCFFSHTESPSLRPSFSTFSVCLPPSEFTFAQL